MPNTVVLDLFLGDSGKGKITDYLAPQHLGVVRFNGSNNAGHTLYVDGTKYKTHAVPSGVLHSHTINFIGHGCVINPAILLQEIQTFAHLNPAIYVSGQAHVVLPSHIEMDIARELKYNIGSTQQGVSPAYESKANRSGIRYENFLLTEEEFITLGSQRTSLSPSELAPIWGLGQQLRDNIITDGVEFIHELKARGSILLEGAQGCFLDIDVGDYPFVTASNCTIGSVLTGTGLSIRDIDEVIGVFKAYGSYVGTKTSFPDIEDVSLNNQLCELGQEYGATTGRRRRLCWLDLDLIARAIQINGPTKLCLTRLDTLGQMPVIKVKHNAELVNFEPWGDISNCRNIQALPPSALRFLDFIERSLKMPIWAVGNGPNREDLLLNQ